MRLSLCSIFLFATLAVAENPEQWGNLARLKPGTNILVTQANGPRLEGKYQSFSGAAITLRTLSGEYSIERDRVVRVSTKPAPEEVFTDKYLPPKEQRMPPGQ